ncbi:winged helix-turn-helix transcriptional regulator [Microbacterium sp. NPDC056052]|uniref:winged helix-turn-helix transcriptional regulator n=1 Tax=Microbacterium sp. NPDC056052 TaxID=3345695 RepID=UPI0035DEBA9A
MVETRTKGTPVSPAHHGRTVTERRAPGGLAEYERSCEGRQGGPEAGRMIRDVLDRVGDKWSLLVVATLGDGVMRFSDLLRHIPGISQRMLTLTLRQLERDGLVIRTAYAEVPPRVEYRLTALGATLIEIAHTIAQWAIANHSTIEKSRAEYDAR